MVDPPGDHARYCRSGADHSASGPHDRSHQKAGGRPARTPAGAAPGSDAWGTSPENGDLSEQSAKDTPGHTGTDLAGDPHRGGDGLVSRRSSRGPRSRLALAVVNQPEP